jgi:arylsulfatase A-like enzyme
MKNSIFKMIFSASLLLARLAADVSAQDKLDRTVLPIQEPKQPTYSELDVRNVEAPPRFEVKPPKKAPNVVIVLIDDVGFGATSTFGGPIQTPTLDRLARSGLRFNNFHTTALCSPTRMCIKTGRNHHTCNTGSIMETATAFPGNTGQLPNSVAPLAEMLRLNGYSTGAFGKWHETAAWETSVSGPFDRWPTQQGFDKFYGFIGGETDQWYPLVYDGVTKVNPPNIKDYHFTVDMTNQAINWVKAQQSMTPDKPFFVYFATGAVHAPHHVPKAWADKYQGKFDKGWDQIRQETTARQKKLGLIPADTQLAPRPDDIKAWDTLPTEHRRLFSRQAEVFAGFMEQTDHEVGRLVHAIEDIGEMDNTLFIYVAGDNGTSAEGGFVGMYNEMTYFNNVTEKVEDLIPLIDKWGGPETFPHMAAGWAVAFDAPFTWTKQVASDFGGTRNGMVIHWPQGIEDKGGLRKQFGHAIDVAPTVLEATMLPEPKSVNGTPQTPIEGTSLVYTFNDAKAKERHTTQYFEMFGNRAIYHNGWLARTLHRAPWQTTKQKPLESDVWDLYDVGNDFSLVNNLAAEQPERLKKLQTLFMKEAEKYHVLPIDDRVIARVNPAIAGLPDVMGNRKSLSLY